MNYIQEHIDKNYFVKLKTTTKIQGIAAWFPKNIILDMKEEELIYLIEDNHICIFRDKKKIETFDCPRFASRMAIGTDIVKRAQQRNISDNLIVAFDEDGNKIPDMKQIATLIKESDEIDTDLENQLKIAFKESMQNPEYKVPASIKDGFEIIINRYIGEEENGN